MSQAEFLALAAVYQNSCRLIGGGLLEGLICSLINILQVLNLTIVVDIAASLGIDLSPVLVLVQSVLGIVNDLLGGGLGLGVLGTVTGSLGGVTGLLGGGLGGLGSITGLLGGIGRR